MKTYGQELILDLYDCDTMKFNRKDIRLFFKQMCKILGMQRCKLTFWDYFWTPKFMRTKDPKIYGTSAVQFIMTSNITLHALHKLKRVYLNIFSCKEIDRFRAEQFAVEFFNASTVKQSLFMGRK